MPIKIILLPDQSKKYVFVGGQQPSEQKQFAPSQLDVPVNNPPFNKFARIAITATIIALCQPPDPSPFIGGAQPCAPRTLNPSITAVSVDNPPGIANDFEAWTEDDPLPTVRRYLPQGSVVSSPPFSHRERTAQHSSVVWINQPDPWTYSFFGGWQPYAPRTLAPALIAVRVDEPPHSQRTALPNILAAWQPPDPLPTLPEYLPQGTQVVSGYVPYAPKWLSAVQAWQPPDPPPTTPRTLNPSITAVAVDNPPGFANDLSVWSENDPLPTLPRYVTQSAGIVVDTPHSSRTVLSNILTSWQTPDPLPTLSNKLNPAITAVSVNNPPFGQRDALPNILSAWVAPDPLPTLRSKLPTSLTAIIANNPPFGQKRPFYIALSWQPPDHPPTIPRKLSPGIPGLSIDQPPGFINGVVVYSEEEALPTRSHFNLPPSLLSVDTPPPRIKRYFDTSAWWQLDPLPQLSGKLSPGIPGEDVDNPPFGQNHPFNAIIAWQPGPPDLPTLPRYLVQPLIIFAVNEPPYTHPGRTVNAAVAVTAWQPPDPNAFIGGQQPLGPRLFPPAITASQVDQPPPNQRKSLPGILSAWQPPDPLPTLTIKMSPGIPGEDVDNPQFGQQRPFSVTTAWQPGPPDLPQQIGKLSPSIPGLSVDQPPKSRYRPQAELIGWLPPAPPIEPQHKLVPTLLAVNVSNPPFRHPGRTASLIIAVSIGQPDLWTYTFTGGRQPFAPRTLTPPSGIAPPPIVVVPPAGGGHRKPFQQHTVAPAVEEKPADRTRPKHLPTWKQQKLAELFPPPAPPPAAPPPAPLPPPGIFSQPAKPQPLNTAALPTFDHLGVDNPNDLAQRMQEAQDLSDIMRLFEAMSSKTPPKA